MGENKRAGGRVPRRDRKAAVTPDMLWPSPNEAAVVPLESAGARARRNHPSVWAKRLGRSDAQPAELDPRVILSDGHEVIDLSNCGNPCGNGAWCETCRSEIRREALRWLRELNVVRPPAGGPVLAWSRAWNQDLLLADR